MMFAVGEKQLHWQQRIALVRHNFHSARRNGDYTFFKAIQAHAFVQGTDYVATLTAALGSDADAVFTTLDNLNAGIAYVFQDAFKKVHDNLKTLMMGNSEKDYEGMKAQLHVDVEQEIQRADFAIDRVVNSAIALIQLQPTEHQADVACAWILGATIMTDSVSVSMHELDRVDSCIGDFIKLENSWSTVQSSVDSAITALRGILNLMATDDANDNTSSNNAANTASPMTMLRKFSTVLGYSAQASQPPPPPYKKCRTASVSPSATSLAPPSSTSSRVSPSLLRQSFAHAIPTKLPNMPRPNLAINSNFGSTNLETIPGTPGVMNEGFKFGLPSPRSDDGEDSAIDTKDHYVRPKV